MPLQDIRIICILHLLLCDHYKYLYYTGREQSELDILLFTEVLDHISRVDRVLTQPGGSLLMGGRSGVGRRTAVSLVAFMHQITLYTPNVSRNFGVKQFKNDLKNVRMPKNIACIICMYVYMCKYTHIYYMYLCTYIIVARQI